MFRTVLVTDVVLAAAGVAWGAAPLAESTFNGGSAEEWTAGNFWNGTATATPEYVGSGGTPGGFLRVGDVAGWAGFIAPAAFLGNKSDAYGGSIFVSQRVVSSDGVNYPMVALSDGVTTLQYKTTPPTNNVWTSYEIPLLPHMGWEVAPDQNGSPGPAPSIAQMLQVLSNLTFMTFEADWQSGADQVDIDEVRLTKGFVIDFNGDADGDGDVDLDDQGIWAANFTGSLPPGTGTSTYFQGDFDGDKDVDLDDQGIWASNFTGSLAPSGLAVAVPEPGGLSLVLALGGAWLRRRRRV